MTPLAGLRLKTSGCLRRFPWAIAAQRFDELRRLNENRKVGSRGPVAQLGARFHGMEEVIGSIPIRSTNTPLNTNSLLASAGGFSGR